MHTTMTVMQIDYHNTADYYSIDIMTVLLIDYYNTADYSIDYSNDRTADDFSLDYYDTTHHCFIDSYNDCRLLLN